MLAVDYIYTYYSLPLTVDEIASASCLSKFHFIRLFKIVYNQSPYQFINEVRVRRAQEMLKHTRLNVKEIAATVGFDDASTFSKMFYRKVGTYPLQFRR
jgi:AraC family transcriptional regulator